MYNYQDFSKKDKKLLQQLMEIAVQREIENFIKKTFPIHKNLVEKKHEDIRIPYWELADKFKNFSNRITGIYDGYKHGDIPSILASSIVNGDLKMEDFTDFSDSGKQKIEEMVNRIKKYR